MTSVGGAHPCSAHSLFEASSRALMPRRPKTLLALAVFALTATAAPHARADGPEPQPVAANEAVPPRLLELPTPAPIEGLSVEVVVDVHVIVSAEGRATEAHVERTAPDVENDVVRALVFQAAEDACRDAVFEPARIGERVVASRVHVTVRIPAPVAAQPEPSPTEVPPVAEPVAEPAPAETPPEATPSEETQTSPTERPAPSFAAHAAVDADTADRPRSAVSDFEITLGMLARVPRANAQAMLTLAPGVFLSNHAGEGHAASMFMRGFSAGTGQDIEFKVDGIALNEPSNAHGHGYADTLMVIPELVRELRVTQGPFDPMQGDYAVAGSVEYQLGVTDRGIHVLTGYGSYNQKRLTAWWAPRGQHEGTFAGVSLRQGDGWGPNRAFGQAIALGQYEGSFDGERGHYRLLVHAQGATWDSTTPIREDDYAAGRLPCAADSDSQFFCSYDPNVGGTSLRIGASGVIEWIDGEDSLRAQVFSHTRGFRNRENFTGYTLDPRTDGGPQRGDNLEQRYDATTVGARALYRRNFDWLGQRQQLELGFYARHDGIDTVTDRIRRELDAPYATDFDRTIRTTNIAVYGRASLRFLDWLHVLGGVRVDTFYSIVVDNNLLAMDRLGSRLTREGADAFGYVIEPRGTVRFDLAKGLSWLVSGGLGARSTDAAAISDGELAPFARVVAAETGLAYEAGDKRVTLGSGDYSLVASASAFMTRVENDLVFDPERGRNTVTGPSNRTGAMATGRFRYDGWLDAQLSFTYTRAHLPADGTSALSLFSGPRLPYVPETQFRADIAAEHPITIGDERFVGSLALGGLLMGPRPLPLGEYTEPFFVVDAAATARWRFLELGLRVENLFDARYKQVELNYVSNFGDPNRAPSMMPGRHFMPGAPLQAMVTLAFHEE